MRKGLSLSEQLRFNHPTAVLRRWKADTEPQEARRAKRHMTEPKDNPHLAALADAELERDDARHQTETLRGLLGIVRAEWRDMRLELREIIARALAE